MMYRMVAVALIFALALGLYYSKTDADRARERVAALEAELARTRDEVNTLAAEAAHLGGPARIEALAKSGLGMEPVRPEQLAAPPPTPTPEGAP